MAGESLQTFMLSPVSRACTIPASYLSEDRKGDIPGACAPGSKLTPAVAG